MAACSLLLVPGTKSKFLQHMSTFHVLPAPDRNKPAKIRPRCVNVTADERTQIPSQATVISFDAPSSSSHPAARQQGFVLPFF